jgi:hypothetical protein
VKFGLDKREVVEYVVQVSQVCLEIGVLNYGLSSTLYIEQLSTHCKISASEITPDIRHLK